MRTIRFLGLLATVLLSFSGVLSNVAAAPLQQSPSPVPPGAGIVRYVDETQDPRQASGISEVISWASERYRLGGIGLPEATVTFHREKSSCGGLDGYHTWSAGRHRIGICVGGTLQRERTVLHELSHAWIADHLDDRAREDFLSRRGLDDWNDTTGSWSLRGTEQAAMIIAWGLDETCETPSDLVGDDIRSLTIEFEFLTGSGPICSR